MERYDILIVGGGINGAGIARDAAGRGLKVLLVERGDLGGATSSASSKLIHGGLRYLEQFQFRLVAEALAEREILLANAPHLVRPVHFVMPHVPALRPAWMIRAGLFGYDYLARRHALDASAGINLRESRYGAELKPELKRGFVYSDCAVDDARLVIMTIRSAADLGATIRPRTACVSAERRNGVWQAILSAEGCENLKIEARTLVNATGPWVAEFLLGALGYPPNFAVRLVKGSHILVPRLYEGSHAYILQNEDGRVVFVCAFDELHSLIGTTEVTLERMAATCETSGEEVEYLCRAINRYFSRAIAPSDVVWSYCGVRPLLDDGSLIASKVTREYELIVDGRAGEAPIVSLVGGKITVFRRVAEKALAALSPWLTVSRPWTSRAALPGGELGCPTFADFSERRIARDFPWLPRELGQALARRHGALTYDVVGPSAGMRDLGEHFGAGLYAREVDYFLQHEWARTADDVMWRRTKSGLYLGEAQRASLARYIAQRLS